MGIKQKPKKGFLVLYDRKAIHNIPFGAIIRVEAQGAYSLTHTTLGEKYTSCKNLSTIHKELTRAGNFCRIHNSHIVNLSQVKMYKKESAGVLVMTDDSEVPVSRRKKTVFLKNIKKAAIPTAMKNDHL